jgi:hypothetical protein
VRQEGLDLGAQREVARARLIEEGRARVPAQIVDLADDVGDTRVVRARQGLPRQASGR